MNKTGFIRYFGWPEFKSIAGEKGKSLVVLIAIIFISLIAIGLGKSATQSLERKMNDPFIKFVKVKKTSKVHRFLNKISIKSLLNNVFLMMK